MKSRHLAFCAVFVAACEEPDFSSPSEVKTVRILAVRSDASYVAPGDTVNLEVLAHDGRERQPAPMSLFFIPSPCVNPARDVYYACFDEFENEFETGIDLSPALTAGRSFSFQMPSDVISSHEGPSSSEPYGIAYAFTLACAGTVQYVPGTESPDSVPFGCFDDSGARLGADSFVFAYTTVYAFSERNNDNPIVERITFDGEDVDLEEGIHVGRCTRSDPDDCPKTEFDVILPESSQELDPGNRDGDGNVLKEQIYVQYFSTAGRLEHDTLVLFDPRKGRLSDTGNEFRAPRKAGDHALWIVVRDNRGGVSWVELPVHIQ